MAPHIPISELTFSDVRPEHEAAIRQMCDATHAAHRARLPHIFDAENAHVSGLIDHALRCDETTAEELCAVIRCACHQGAVIGYVLIAWVAPKPPEHSANAMIADIAVASDMRGQGIGSALLAHARETMTRYNLASLSADVWQGNPASHAIFERAAFRPERTTFRFGTPVPRPAITEPPKQTLLKNPLLPIGLILLLLGAALAFLSG